MATTPDFLPGKSHGQRSLLGYSPWGHKEWDTTDHTSILSMLLLLFSCPIVSDSLRPHGLQHARSHCPSPSPEVCASSCPLHWWCHPASYLYTEVMSGSRKFPPLPLSFPGVGNGNSLQYSCLENSKDRGDWRARVQRITKSRTQLSD